MYFHKALIFCLVTALLGLGFCSQPLSAQEEQPLLLSASLGGRLMLGAIDRLVIPAKGQWQVTNAPSGVSFSPGVWLYDGINLFAGTAAHGLYRKNEDAGP